MFRHHYPAIFAHDNATVHLGDQITHLTNHGPLVLLDSQVFDVDSLQQQVEQTSTDCTELRRLIQDAKLKVPFGQADVSDLDELESMVETLKFHLEEDDFKAGEGWQRPLQDVGHIVGKYRDSVSTMKRNIDALRQAENPVRIDLTLSKSDVRDLRLKLSMAVAMISFCALQSSNRVQLEEIRNVDTRLKYVLEELENEKAAKIASGQPLTAFVIGQVDADPDLVMQRHMARSLDTEQETMRAASMQVSTILDDSSMLAALTTNNTSSDTESDSQSLVSTTITSVLSETDSIRTHRTTTVDVPHGGRDLSLATTKYQWVTISVVFGMYPEYEEILSCRILANLDEEIRELKLELIHLYGALLKKYLNCDPHPFDLKFFYGIMKVTDASPLRQYCHKQCSPRITCILWKTTVDAEGSKAENLTLQGLRRFVRRRAEYNSPATLQKSVPLSDDLGFVWTENPGDIAQLLPQVLALTTLGMIYDDERGKYTAIEAYSQAYCLLEAMIDKLAVPDGVAVTENQITIFRRKQDTLRLIAAELATRLVVLDQAECQLPTFVYAKASSPGVYLPGQKLRVLAALPDISRIKVMPASDNLLSSAWDLRNGWILWDAVDTKPPAAQIGPSHVRSSSAPNVNLIVSGVGTRLSPLSQVRRKACRSQQFLLTPEQQATLQENDTNRAASRTPELLSTDDIRERLESFPVSLRDGIQRGSPLNRIAR